MAARRKAGSDEGSGEGKESRSEDSIRRSRHERKAVVQAQQKRLDWVRWAVVVVVLLLLLIGLYYYYTNMYQLTGGTGNVTGGGGKVKDRVAKDVERKKKSDAKSKAAKSDVKSKAAKSDGGAKTGATDSKKSAKSKLTERDGGKDAKSKTTAKQAKKNPSAPKSKTKPASDIPTIAVSDMRLLRRPVPAEDSDRPYIIEILNGDNLLLEERFSEGLEKFNEVLKMFPQSPRGLFGKGETLTGLARQKSSNKLRDIAIDFYQDAANSFLAPKDLKVAALVRLAELCQERGKHAAAIAALERLYELEGDDPAIANRLGAGYITTGDTKKAAEHFRKLLNETPDNYYAKAHLGFLLFRDKKYEEALPLLMEGIRRDASIQRNGRFYLYAGEALMRLNRSDEAHVLYSEAVAQNLFPSLYQRSLFNEPGLRAQPWWSLQETGYQPQLQLVLDAVDNITSEVIPALLGDSRLPPRLFPLFSQGKKNAENCRKVPQTCALLQSIPEASSCKHGEVKFIVVPPGTHVPPHTGQTNTRLEVVVGLSLGEGQLSVRLAEETKVLKEGGVLVYDDSFEQELWFTSSRPGLVLSMAVWHPDLSLEQHRRLAPIH